MICSDLSADQTIQVFRVALALHGNLRCGAVDLAKIVGGQRQRGRADILLETMLDYLLIRRVGNPHGKSDTHTDR